MDGSTRPEENSTQASGARRRAYRAASTLLACVLSACGGIEDAGGPLLEEAEGPATTTTCLGPIDAEYRSLETSLLDTQTKIALRDVLAQLIVAVGSCTSSQPERQRRPVHSCFDPALNRHYESFFCALKRPDGGLRTTTQRERFQFSVIPVQGADARPIYRCLRDGRDMITRSPTCGLLNIAPTSELGYSFPSTRAGATEVFRCRRPGPADIFMSRDPACEGFVREASLGFAL